MAGVGKNSEARDLPSAELGGRQAAGVLWLGARPAWALARRVNNTLRSLRSLDFFCLETRVFVLIKYLSTSEHRNTARGRVAALTACPGHKARRRLVEVTSRVPKPPLQTTNQWSPTPSVGEPPHSPVSWSRQTPDSTNSDSRPSEPARLASSWPTRKSARASHGPVGHQWPNGAGTPFSAPRRVTIVEK